jgi:hypothetical protein
MARKFDLKAISDELERRYGDVIIEDGDGTEVLRLTPLMRLDADRRSKLAELQDKLSETKAETIQSDMDEFFALVCPEPAQYQAALALLGDNIGTRNYLMDLWGSETQSGEAQPSQA